ncbi:hypothetical protein [Schaalia sp. Marseille-Q2122]|uniref:hypothetical protein n=1 Tax=Schaalia sp. Marseille-Q2122 TaxID=2736604 RepID=UPI00158A694D|nr:hypothetical protein [Schaalia sp. Marseille-Q2122]
MASILSFLLREYLEIESRFTFYVLFCSVIVLNVAEWLLRRRVENSESIGGRSHKNAAREEKRYSWRIDILYKLLTLALAAVPIFLMDSPESVQAPIATPESVQQSDVTMKEKGDSVRKSSGQDSVQPVQIRTIKGGYLPAGIGCPLPNDLRDEVNLMLRVYWWCHAPAYTEEGYSDPNQFQLKVRLGIENGLSSKRDVSISIDRPSAIRLLIPCLTDSLDWRPPPLTREAGDSPTCVLVDDQNVWAIPPDVNDDLIKLADGSGYNHISHWHPEYLGQDDMILSPGERIGDDSKADGLTSAADLSERGNIYTDLVFTVPGMTDSTPLYGIAIFDTAGSDDPAKWSLIALCEQEKGCFNERNKAAPSMF